MTEPLYVVEEFCTTGWEVVQENLTRSQASSKLEDLINHGVNPDHLRVKREV
jgi:hypothetical protein